MIEIKKTVREMKNTFDELISGLDIMEERISELEVMSVEPSKTEMWKKKEWKHRTEYSRTVEQLPKV